MWAMSTIAYILQKSADETKLKYISNITQKNYYIINYKLDPHVYTIESKYCY